MRRKTASKQYAAQRGEVLIISIEPVVARDCPTIWGELYNRTFADVFAVQYELAGDIDWSGFPQIPFSRAQ